MVKNTMIEVKEKFIPLMRPDLLDEDIEQVVKVLKSGMLIQGVEVQQLESYFCQYLGIPYASALSNGTATLHLALICSRIGKGDEVIVPAFSYMATANVVELVGAKPVFVDINIDTFNIDVNQIENAITPKTKAIIPVHEFGLAANMDAIMQIASANNLIVIEDAACALGATFNNKFAGTFGQFGSFSLHPRKAVTSGEGGILVTRDLQSDKKIKILRNHGIETINGKMEFVEAGFNYRMTDFQAALVKSQLPRLNMIIGKRNNLAKIYLDNLDKNKLLLPHIPQNQNHTWQTFHVVLNDKLDRDKIMHHLKEKHIGTNYGAQCMPFQKYYSNKYKLNCDSLFPNALRAYRQGLALPLYDSLQENEMHYIIETIHELTGN